MTCQRGQNDQNLQSFMAMRKMQSQTSVNQTRSNGTGMKVPA